MPSHSVVSVLEEWATRRARALWLREALLSIDKICKVEGAVSLQKRLDALEAVVLARMKAELRVLWLDFSVEEVEAIAGREDVDEEFRDAALAKMHAAASPELRRMLWGDTE